MCGRIIKAVGKLILLTVGLAAAIFLALILYSAVIYPMYLESRASIGMARQDVLDRLASHEYQLSDAFPLCEAGAWKGDCTALAQSDSVEFLTLKTGIDTWLVVGFGRDGKVSFVGLGDT